MKGTQTMEDLVAKDAFCQLFEAAQGNLNSAESGSSKQPPCIGN